MTNREWKLFLIGQSFLPLELQNTLAKIRGALIPGHSMESGTMVAVNVVRVRHATSMGFQLVVS